MSCSIHKINSMPSAIASTVDWPQRRNVVEYTCVKVLWVFKLWAIVTTYLRHFVAPQQISGGRWLGLDLNRRCVPHSARIANHYGDEQTEHCCCVC